MSLYKNKYRIESSRLKGWDYSNPGAYFVTICTKGMINYFGEIEIDNKIYSIDEIRDLVKLNASGKIVEEEWINTSIIRNNVILDEFVVMPNHFHGIIFIIDNQNKELIETPSARGWVVSTGLKPNSLGSIIGQFKSICTKRIRGIGNLDFAWQSRFHEHIIRSEKSLNNIRDYIIHNPIKWKFDKYYRKK